MRLSFFDVLKWRTFGTLRSAAKGMSLLWVSSVWRRQVPIRAAIVGFIP